MTIDELKQIIPDATAETWRQLPGGGWAHVTATIGAEATIGERSTIGARSTIGDAVTIGEWSKIGDAVTIGARSKIGERSTIGEWSKIGEWSTIGKCSAIGERSTIGARSKIGKWSMIGDEVTIGERSTIGARSTIGDAVTIGRDTILCLGRMGSRHAVLTAVAMRGTVYIGTGCFWGTVDKFEARVKSTHGDNQHGRDYGAACRFLREWAAPRLAGQAAEPDQTAGGAR